VREGREYRAPGRVLPLRGAGILGMGLAVKILAGVLAGATPLGDGPGARFLFLFLALLLLAGGLVLASIGCARILRIGEEGIRIVRWLAPTLELSFGDIERIESVSGIGWFHSGEHWILHLRGGRRVRIRVEEFAESDRREAFGPLNSRISPSPTAATAGG
jgi:hypothetical protein